MNFWRIMLLDRLQRVWSWPLALVLDSNGFASTEVNVAVLVYSFVEILEQLHSEEAPLRLLLTQFDAFDLFRTLRPHRLHGVLGVTHHRALHRVLAVHHVIVFVLARNEVSFRVVVVPWNALPLLGREAPLSGRLVLAALLVLVALRAILRGLYRPSASQRTLERLAFEGVPGSFKIGLGPAMAALHIGI